MDAAALYPDLKTAAARVESQIFGSPVERFDLSADDLESHRDFDVERAFAFGLNSLCLVMQPDGLPRFGTVLGCVRVEVDEISRADYNDRYNRIYADAPLADRVARSLEPEIATEAWRKAVRETGSPVLADTPTCRAAFGFLARDGSFFQKLKKAANRAVWSDRRIVTFYLSLMENGLPKTAARSAALALARVDKFALVGAVRSTYSMTGTDVGLAVTWWICATQ